MKASLFSGSNGPRHSFSRKRHGKPSTKLGPVWVRRGLAFVSLTALLAIQQAGHVQAVGTQPPNPLPDPHSYVVTGNYAVGSINIPSQIPQGTWTGRIHISTCPNTAVPGNPAPVSYTHLTLPTILRV